MAHLKRCTGQPILAGNASASILATAAPLSLWGGLDPNTGEVIDRRHPLSGQFVGGRALALPSGRGSCSASGVLLEAIRNGVAPAIILLRQIDPIIGLGVILADELYGEAPPTMVLSAADFDGLHTGDSVSVSGSTVLIESRVE